MSNLHPRLRELLSQPELDLLDRGLCSTGGPDNRCLQPVDPEARFGQCTEHDCEVRASLGDAYFSD